MHRSTLSLFLALVPVTACNEGFPRGSGSVVLSADPARTGTDGTLGPSAVARTVVTAQARVTDPLPIEVTYPATSTGSLDRSRAPYPAVVFAQGGLVAGTRYRWLAEHFASRGYVVIAPEHLGDLAFFETDNLRIALRTVRAAAADASPDSTLRGALAENGKVVFMGHSLGGVVAVRQWIDTDASGVVLLASYPAAGDPVQRRAGSPVLSLVGSNDTRKSPLESYQTGFQTFSTPRWFGLVDGMNHYAWCDQTTSAELSGDGPLTRDLTLVRRDAFRMLDTFLDAVLRDDMNARMQLDAGLFSGIQVQR